MKNYLAITALSIFCLAIFTGCNLIPGKSTTNTSPTVGGDKDSHGCIGSAGYTWCDEKQKCLRTWEEACQ